MNMTAGCPLSCNNNGACVLPPPLLNTTRIDVAALQPYCQCNAGFSGNDLIAQSTNSCQVWELPFDILSFMTLSIYALVLIRSLIALVKSVGAGSHKDLFIRTKLIFYLIQTISSACVIVQCVMLYLRQQYTFIARLMHLIGFSTHFPTIVLILQMWLMTIPRGHLEPGSLLRRMNVGVGTTFHSYFVAGFCFLELFIVGAVGLIKADLIQFSFDLTMISAAVWTAIIGPFMLWINSALVSHLGDLMAASAVSAKTLAGPRTKLLKVLWLNFIATLFCFFCFVVSVLWPLAKNRIYAVYLPVTMVGGFIVLAATFVFTFTTRDRVASTATVSGSSPTAAGTDLRRAAVTAMKVKELASNAVDKYRRLKHKRTTSNASNISTSNLNTTAGGASTPGASLCANSPKASIGDEGDILKPTRQFLFSTSGGGGGGEESEVHAHSKHRHHRAFSTDAVLSQNGLPSQLASPSHLLPKGEVKRVRPGEEDEEDELVYGIQQHRPPRDADEEELAEGEYLADSDEEDDDLEEEELDDSNDSLSPDNDSPSRQPGRRGGVRVQRTPARRHGRHPSSTFLRYTPSGRAVRTRNVSGGLAMAPLPENVALSSKATRMLGYEKSGNGSPGGKHERQASSGTPTAGHKRMASDGGGASLVAFGMNQPSPNIQTPVSSAIAPRGSDSKSASAAPSSQATTIISNRLSSGTNSPLLQYHQPTSSPKLSSSSSATSGSSTSNVSALQLPPPSSSSSSSSTSHHSVPRDRGLVVRIRDDSSANSTPIPTPTAEVRSHNSSPTPPLTKSMRLAAHSSSSSSTSGSSNGSNSNTNSSSANSNLVASSNHPHIYLPGVVTLERVYDVDSPTNDL